MSAAPNPATEQLHVRYRPIDSMTMNTRNPRVHSKAQIRQLAKSIAQFGFNVPILIDANRQVVAGHGRLLACQSLGLTEVPTIELNHLTREQVTAFLIADNKLSENAEWSDVLLAEHFLELSALDLDFELDITGFSMCEIDLLIEGVQDARADDADVMPSAVDGPAITQPGDLWLLGKHRLLCGNALNGDDYALLMNRKRAAIIVTDPPWNLKIAGHVGGLGAIHHREFAMASGEMNSAEFTAFLSRVMTHLAAHSTDGSIHYLFIDWRHMHEMISAGEASYSRLLNLCVWSKGTGGMGSLYRSEHELVFAWKSGEAPHQNHVELGKHGRYRTNVWRCAGMNSFAGRSTDEGNLLASHPTVKPVQLIIDALLDTSSRNDIVLDPFLGSGTTLIAADRVGRICYGMELDPLYVDGAIRRWQRWTGQSARRADGVLFDDLASEVRHG